MIIINFIAEKYFCVLVGLENAKRCLQEIVDLPALRPDVSVMLNKGY